MSSTFCGSISFSYCPAIYERRAIAGRAKTGARGPGRDGPGHQKSEMRASLVLSRPVGTPSRLSPLLVTQLLQVSK